MSPLYLASARRISRSWQPSCTVISRQNAYLTKFHFWFCFVVSLSFFLYLFLSFILIHHHHHHHHHHHPLFDFFSLSLSSLNFFLSFFFALYLRNIYLFSFLCVFHFMGPSSFMLLSLIPDEKRFPPLFHWALLVITLCY